MNFPEDNKEHQRLNRKGKEPHLGNGEPPWWIPCILIVIMMIVTTLDRSPGETPISREEARTTSKSTDDPDSDDSAGFSGNVGNGSGGFVAPVGIGF